MKDVVEHINSKSEDADNMNTMVQVNDKVCGQFMCVLYDHAMLCYDMILYVIVYIMMRVDRSKGDTDRAVQAVYT